MGNNKRLCGQVSIAGDKSISHRSIILSALALGKSRIKNLLIAGDLLTTINCLRAMGVNIYKDKNDYLVDGVGLLGLKKPKDILYCGNSGTSMRLLSGVLIGQNFSTILNGDNSLNKRPMDRIIIPLTMMGGEIKAKGGKYPPLEIEGRNRIKGIKYKMPIDSAQVKSAILLAGLYSEEKTTIVEKNPTRDHTELMLNYFGCNVVKNKNEIYLQGKELYGQDIFIPGDISSASFFIVGGLLIKSSEILIKNVGVNPTRTGVISILRKMGGEISIENKRILNNEIIGDILVKSSTLKGTYVKNNVIATLIDEIPIIAVAASLAKGNTVIENVVELKYKESNRLDAIISELRKMGVNIFEENNNLIIVGGDSLKGNDLDSYNDHRIAMALYIAALIAEGESRISNFDCINISLPNFLDIINRLTN